MRFIRPSASALPLQAVVLAGGKGTRLRPLTYGLPKPLLPVMGRPLLAHIVERLPKEVDEVLLTVSYMAGHLRQWAAHANDPALEGRQIRVITERQPLGTGGAVQNCADLIDGTFFVMNGDLLSDVDFRALLARHRDQGALGTISLYQVADPSRYGVVEQDDAGRILRFVEKPPAGEAPSDRVNAGAYVLEPEVLDLIEAGRPVSIEREVFPRVADTERGLWGLPFQGLWVDCGTPESYLGVHHELLARTGRTHMVANGTKVEAEADALRGSVIGAGGHIGAGARVQDSVLLDDVQVGAGALIERSIVASGARILPGARLVDCVVGAGEAVAEGSELIERRLGMRAGDA